MKYFFLILLKADHKIYRFCWNNIIFLYEGKRLDLENEYKYFEAEKFNWEFQILFGVDMVIDINLYLIS